MNNIGFGFLLCISTPALYAMEAKEIKQEDISQEDHTACRKVMLDDALHAFISATKGELHYEIREHLHNSRVIRHQVKRRKKNDEKEDQVECFIGMYTIGSKIELIEEIYNAAKLNTAREKLIKQHQKIHPVECYCGIGINPKSKVSLDYLFEPAGVFHDATFRALYTHAEVQQALDIMLKKVSIMQQNAFPGSRKNNKKLLLPENFNQNLGSIQQLLEHKDA